MTPDTIFSEDNGCRAIGRETVYYTRRPLRIIYLLIAGRKPISVKQSVIFDRETVNPGYSTSLFYISFLIPFVYCLISIIYLIHILPRKDNVRRHYSGLSKGS